jgi:tetratricopeptide (TPR) repeat protein
VRITGQLIDTSTGDHVWAEKYDCEFDRLIDVQDDLAATIVSMVAGNIEQKAVAQAKRKQPADMLAYDCLLHGLDQHRLGGVTRESVENAIRWFDLAIEKDPSYGRAHAWRACALSTLAEWTGEDAWAEILETGRRGLELDDKEAECHRIMGSLSLYVRDYERSEYHFKRALDLNPNHAYIVGRIGELYNFLGDGNKALEYQERAKQLDPFLPAGCRELEVVAHYVLGDYGQSVRVASQLPRLTRRAAAYRAAAYAHLAEESDTTRAATDLRTIDPSFTIKGFLASEFYKDRWFRQQTRP